MADDIAAFTQRLGVEMDENRAEVLVLTPAELVSILQDKASAANKLEEVRRTLGNTTLGRLWNQTGYPALNQPAVLPAGQLTIDLYTLGKTLIALGIVGTQLYEKQANGKTYVIIKGYAGLRNHLQGTRYLATNPKIIQMGLGAKGLANVAKSGFILGVVVSAGIEVMDFMFNDEKTMMDLVGNIGYECVKSGVVSVIAYGGGLAVASVVGVAVAPLGAMLVIAFGVGVGLNYLDNELQVKAKVLKAFKSLPENIGQGIYALREDTLNRLESLKQDLDRQVTLLLRNAADRAIDAAVNALKQQIAELFERYLVPRMR